MTARTITARYPGTCRACRGAINPGDTIRHAGRGRSYHADCSDDGVTTVRTSSGWTGTRNTRGRCEDAPCCGCCTY